MQTIKRNMNEIEMKFVEIEEQLKQLRVIDKSDFSCCLQYLVQELKDLII